MLRVNDDDDDEKSQSQSQTEDSGESIESIEAK